MKNEQLIKGRMNKNENIHSCYVSAIKMSTLKSGPVSVIHVYTELRNIS